MGTVSAGAPLEEEASPQLDHSASLREQLEQRYLDPAQQMSDAFLEEQRKQSAAQKAAAVEIAAASGLSEREVRSFAMGTPLLLSEVFNNRDVVAKGRLDCSMRSRAYAAHCQQGAQSASAAMLEGLHCPVRFPMGPAS